MGGGMAVCFASNMWEGNGWYIVGAETERMWGRLTQQRNFRSVTSHKQTSSSFIMAKIQLMSFHIHISAVGESQFGKTFIIIARENVCSIRSENYGVTNEGERGKLIE